MNASNNTLWPNYIDYPQKKSINHSFTTDYLIIGAGITGLCAAHSLSELKPNAKITIVDKDTPLNNASNNNAGFAMRISRFFGDWQSNNLNTFNRTNRINEFGYNRLRTLTQHNIAKEDFQDIGLIHAGRSDKARKNDTQYQKCLDDARIDYREWDDTQCAHHIGSDFYRHGIFVPKGCALIQPAALTKALIEGLPANCMLHFDSEVTRLEPNGIALINDYNIRANRIIIATNYHTINGLKFNKRAFGLTLAGSITKPLDAEDQHTLGELKQWGILSSHPLGATVRFTHDRRLMLRNTIGYNRNKPLNPSQLNQAQQHHFYALKQRFPTLSFDIERSWSAVEGRTYNETSYFKKLNDKVFCSSVYNGSGVTKGATLGTHIAYLAANEEAPLMSDIFKHFPKAQYTPKNHFLLNLGISSTIKWKMRDLGED